MPNDLLQLGVAGLSVFLMFKITNGRMKDMTVAFDEMRQVIEKLHTFLSKND